MAKYGGQSFAIFLVDGYNLLAAKVKTVTSKIESLLEPSHGLGDSWEESLPTGLKKASLTQDGAFFDDSANGMHDALKASQDTIRVASYAFAGNTIGKPFIGIAGVFGLSYDVLGTLGALTKANAAYLISGVFERGVILQNHIQKPPPDWDTEGADSVDYTLDASQRVIPITANSLANPSVVTTPISHGLATNDIILIAGVATSNPTINGERTVTVISTTTFSVPVNVTTAGTGGTFVKANSVNGGSAYQQISQFSGFTGFIGKIRHSVDDITYVDLATFANVTAATNGQRVVVAPGTTVHRHLAFKGDVTGSGLITLFAGFARS